MRGWYAYNSLSISHKSMSLEGPKTPSTVSGPEQISEPSLEALKERLSSHDGRFRMVPANPGKGQITHAELSLCDPDSDPETNLASVALVIGTVSDGLTRSQFVDRMVEDDDDEDDEEDEPEGDKEDLAQSRARASQTIDNMLALRLLVERNGAIELNMDLR